MAKAKTVRLFYCPNIYKHYSNDLDSFDHPLVKEMVERTTKQAPGYYRAVHKSAETARKGCSFAQDAVDFCKRLFRAEDFLETLREVLEDIKEVAKNAHQDSEEMHDQFKNVRVELFKVRFLLVRLHFMVFQGSLSLDLERCSVRCSQCVGSLYSISLLMSVLRFHR